jgi:hypothetical protein
MKRQYTHADLTLLPRRWFGKRANIQLSAEVELTSSFKKLFLDDLALLLMLPAMTVLTILVAIPNALAGPTLFEGIIFLAARRTTLALGPIFRGEF